MKVLWFSNTPAGGDEILNAAGCRSGWLSSLDIAIREKVELSVAFYYARFSEPFKYKGVSYFPICYKNWKFNNIKKSLFGSFINEEDLPKYIDIIKKVQPDVIHIHGAENPFGCILKATNIPVILSYQGSCTIINHKYYSGIEKRYGSHKVFRLFSPYTWIFSRSFNQSFKNSTRERMREIGNIKSCKNIIGRTDWDRRITRIIAPQSVYYHCDEILRDSFHQNIWKKPDNKKIIVHTTSGESIFKGFETVCQALNELNKIGINIEWRVAGVSKGSLLDKASKMKLKGSYPNHGLILLGNLHEQELARSMCEADIYVMPSHIENSPNSLCEAMMLGMPCITTLAGGSSSLLKDKEEGLVIQDGDPWSMAGAILELIRDSSKAVKYGNAARKRAEQRHDKDKIIKKLFIIYDDVVNKNKYNYRP